MLKSTFKLCSYFCNQQSLMSKLYLATTPQEIFDLHKTNKEDFNKDHYIFTVRLIARQIKLLQDQFNEENEKQLRTIISSVLQDLNILEPMEDLLDLAFWMRKSKNSSIDSLINEEKFNQVQELIMKNLNQDYYNPRCVLNYYYDISIINNQVPNIPLLSKVLQYFQKNPENFSTFFIQQVLTIINMTDRTLTRYEWDLLLLAIKQFQFLIQEFEINQVINYCVQLFFDQVTFLFKVLAQLTQSSSRHHDILLQSLIQLKQHILTNKMKLTELGALDIITAYSYLSSDFPLDLILFTKKMVLSTLLHTPDELDPDFVVKFYIIIQDQLNFTENEHQLIQRYIMRQLLNNKILDKQKIERVMIKVDVSDEFLKSALIYYEQQQALPFRSISLFTKLNDGKDLQEYLHQLNIDETHEQYYIKQFLLQFLYSKQEINTSILENYLIEYCEQNPIRIVGLLINFDELNEFQHKVLQFGKKILQDGQKEINLKIILNIIKTKEDYEYWTQILDGLVLGTGKVRQIQEYYFILEPNYWIIKFYMYFLRKYKNQTLDTKVLMLARRNKRFREMLVQYEDLFIELLSYLRGSPYTKQIQFFIKFFYEEFSYQAYFIKDFLNDLYIEYQQSNEHSLYTLISLNQEFIENYKNQNCFNSENAIQFVYILEKTHKIDILVEALNVALQHDPDNDYLVSLYERIYPKMLFSALNHRDMTKGLNILKLPYNPLYQRAYNQYLNKLFFTKQYYFQLINSLEPHWLKSQINEQSYLINMLNKLNVWDKLTFRQQVVIYEKYIGLGIDYNNQKIGFMNSILNQKFISPTYLIRCFKLFTDTKEILYHLFKIINENLHTFFYFHPLLIPLLFHSKNKIQIQTYLDFILTYSLEEQILQQLFLLAVQNQAKEQLIKIIGKWNPQTEIQDKRYHYAIKIAEKWIGASEQLKKIKQSLSNIDSDMEVKMILEKLGWECQFNEMKDIIINKQLIVENDPLMVQYYKMIKEQQLVLVKRDKLFDEDCYKYLKQQGLNDN